MPPRNRQPVVFVSHGAPTLALDRVKGADLARWAQALPRPDAILAVSAHWLHARPVIGTTVTRPLLHDFVGFPPELYRIDYPAPGAPALAERVRELVPEATLEPDRGWDHGVWVPLLHMHPRADVPVLQLALPGRRPDRALFELGRALAPLRDEGVLVLASGGMVHDLRSLAPGDDAPTPAWALAFERWMRAALEAWELEALLATPERAPEHDRCHPTREHLQPLLVALGAAGEAPGEVSFPVEGFELGTLSRLGVQIG